MIPPVRPDFKISGISASVRETAGGVSKGGPAVSDVYKAATNGGSGPNPRTPGAKRWDHLLVGRRRGGKVSSTR